MEIPKNKLPLLLGKSGMYGQYAIGGSAGSYAGRIAGKDLAKYVVTATNNFATALELLDDAFDELELCKDTESIRMAERIKNFLNKFKNANKD